jgi:hypothetical protein
MVPLALGKVCAACGKERKSKALRYDTESFNPYCDNPYICNDEHPNSVKNLIQNQKETVLVPHEDAVNAYREHLSAVYKDSDIVQKIHRMLTDPITIRVQKPEMAKFLVEFQQENDLDSLSETIRYCVEVVMENRGMFIKEHRDAKAELKRVETVKEAIQEVVKPKDVTVPDDDLTF